MSVFFVQGHWAYGESLCQLVPYAQGVSVYVSTYTLAFIAIDRFFVIIHPFRDRMTLIACSSIILGIWIFALFVTFPYYRFMHQKEINGKLYCEEQWPQSWGMVSHIFHRINTKINFCKKSRLQLGLF